MADCVNLIFYPAEASHDMCYLHVVDGVEVVRGDAEAVHHSYLGKQLYWWLPVWPL